MQNFTVPGRSTQFNSGPIFVTPASFKAQGDRCSGLDGCKIQFRMYIYNELCLSLGNLENNTLHYGISSLNRQISAIFLIYQSHQLSTGCLIGGHHWSRTSKKDARYVFSGLNMIGLSGQTVGLNTNKLAKLQATLVRNRNYDSLTD